MLHDPESLARTIESFVIRATLTVFDQSVVPRSRILSVVPVSTAGGLPRDERLTIAPMLNTPYPTRKADSTPCDRPNVVTATIAIREIT